MCNVCSLQLPECRGVDYIAETACHDQVPVDVCDSYNVFVFPDCVLSWQQLQVTGGGDMAVATTCFKWAELLETQFDKSWIELDTLLLQLEEDEDYSWVDISTQLHIPTHIHTQCCRCSASPGGTQPRWPPASPSWGTRRGWCSRPTPSWRRSWCTSGRSSHPPGSPSTRYTGAE